MKRIIKNISSLAAVTLLLGFVAVSCYDDKGNDAKDYVELDEVVVDTIGTGLQESYAINRFDTLTLNPRVKFNGEVVNGHEENYPLDYTWTIYAAGTGSGVDYTVDTLGTELLLKAPMTRNEGSWVIRLIVTNTETGVMSFYTCSCQINETLSDGWLVLYESANNPGTTDVALIVNSLVKKYYVSEDKVYKDLYSASNGETLNGKPVAVVHSCAPGIMTTSGTYQEVILATEKDMVGVGCSSFNKQLGFSDFFWEAPEPAMQSFGATPTRCENVINGNKVYHANFMSSTYRNTFYGLPYSGDYGTLASWTPTCCGNSYESVVYDQDNRKFICVPFGTLNFSGWDAQDETIAQFDVNNVGLTMMFSDWGYNRYEYSVMQGESNDYYLLVSNFQTSDPTTAAVGLAKYDISTSPNVAKMTSMNCGTFGELMFYGAENKLYLLKYQAGTPASLMNTFPEGEVVTCVRDHKFFFPSLMQMCLNHANEILHVATWNESTKTGKVYMFPIDSASGAITGDVLEYSGFGKVKDMSWKYVLAM